MTRHKEDEVASNSIVQTDEEGLKFVMSFPTATVTSLALAIHEGKVLPKKDVTCVTRMLDMRNRKPIQNRLQPKQAANQHPKLPIIPALPLRPKEKFNPSFDTECPKFFLDTVFHIIKEEKFDGDF
jgi:hypothetical protein